MGASIYSASLLAQWFFAEGRLLEGHYHASAAASLAISCKLFKIRSTDSPPASISPPSSSRSSQAFLGANPGGFSSISQSGGAGIATPSYVSCVVSSHHGYLDLWLLRCEPLSKCMGWALCSSWVGYKTSISLTTALTWMTWASDFKYWPVFESGRESATRQPRNTNCSPETEAILFDSTSRQSDSSTF